MGDGCNMEGISSEAASLAGHWGLGKLICLYDDNRISIDGHTEISFTEDVCARYEAMGWHVQHVQDGNHDLDGLRSAIQTAKVRGWRCAGRPAAVLLGGAGSQAAGAAVRPGRAGIRPACRPGACPPHGRRRPCSHPFCSL